MADGLVRNRTTGEVLARRLVRCDTFLKRGRGLMFRRPLGQDEAYLFVLDRPSVIDAAIHMFFVGFPIAVVWLDTDLRVVHCALAKPWRPYYAPPRPAKYFLEGHPHLLALVHGGDIIDLPAAEAEPGKR